MTGTLALVLSLTLSQADATVARLQALEEAQQQNAWEIEATRQALSRLGAELEQRRARELAEEERRAGDLVALKEMGQRLERVDFMLVDGSSDAAAEIASAKALIDSRLALTSAPPARAVEMSQHLANALVALNDKDPNRARSWVWQAGVALLDVLPASR